MITVRGVRLPQGALRLQRSNHGVPGENVFEAQWAVDGRQACAVAEEPADRHLLFALGGELGPVFGHRCVEVEPALLGQHVRRGRHHTFGRGHDELQRVGRVGAAPQVDHLSPTDVDAAGGADLTETLEVGGERLLHGFETGFH